MNLYLVRHCEALSLGGTVLRDADRPLSPRGERDAALMGKLLALMEPSVRLIATSPLVRASQTAEMLAKHFSHPPVVEQWNLLSPGMQPSDVLERVGAREEESAALVAHQPDLTEFLGHLVAGEGLDIAFPPGAIARVVLSHAATGGGARLQWLVPPAFLSLLHPDW